MTLVYIMAWLRKLSQWAVIALLIGASPGCAYRFTNKHISIPSGIRTIAFENIYDTSREVLPHQILWEALQRSFAKDGHLRVVSQGRADAVLRAHISEAVVRQIGNSFEIPPDKDKNPNADPPADPSNFRILPQAGEFTRRQLLSFKVNVEIVELYTKTVIFNRNYSGNSQFRTAREEQRVAQIKTHYLLYEEALRAKFAEVSQNIADNVVRDFIVGR